MNRASYALLLILLLAAMWRGWLIHTDSVKFNSDEAVVGLMARHITQGKPVPPFYYGQDYMGSLDAMFIAGGFVVLGQSVQTIRIVQTALYLLSVWTGYLLAYHVTRRQGVALATALLLAIPTMLGTLYTTATLGGYNEIILFGNLILLLGWQVTVEQKLDYWRWAALGLVAGLGWWTNGAIITPIGMVGLLGLWRFRVRHWRLYLLVGVMFLVGSASWWGYNLRHDWAALEFLISRDPAPNVAPLSFPEKLVAFFLIGFSALFGFRFPWQATLQSGIAAMAAAGVYLLLVTDGVGRGVAWLRKPRSLFTAPPRGGVLVTLTYFILFLIFMLSPFQDATGRYLMPLWIPTTIGVALGVMRLRWAAPLALGVLVAFQAATILTATQGGIEAQLDEALLTVEADEAALLDFLQAHDYTHGYTSYWVSYRLMFLTDESILFDTSLPYDDNGYRSHNNRYPPYVEAVAQMPDVVWITQNFPDLDRLIEQRLAEAGIMVQTEQIGVYRVYYDFSRRIAPAEIGLNSTEPIERLLIKQHRTD